MIDGFTFKESVPLAPFTTLGVGGPARYLAEAATEDGIVQALIFAERQGLPLFVLGGGSNLVVADEGFDGVVLHIASRGISVRQNGQKTLITGSAGEDWDEFVRFCVERDLAGIECLSGIPGLVGGTPVQNVGAYGQEVSETIMTVRAYDRQQKEIVELPREACGFRYRTSIFNTTERGRYVVLAVTYELTPGGEPAVRYADVRNYFADRMGEPSLSDVQEAVREIRARKAMLLTEGDPDCRSAGSFFKNPTMDEAAFARVEAAARTRQVIFPDDSIPHYRQPDGSIKVPAAWLIERSGFTKGSGRGRVGLSTKHTLAIVNRGGATASEIVAWMQEITERVRAVFGITLVPEPVFVGFPERRPSEGDGSETPIQEP